MSTSAVLAMTFSASYQAPNAELTALAACDLALTYQQDLHGFVCIR